MKVGEALKKIQANFGGKGNAEIIKELQQGASLSTDWITESMASAKMGMPADDIRRLSRNVLGVINTKFDGNAIAAIKFFQELAAGNPALADQSLDDLIESGRMAQMIDQSRTNSTALNTTRAAPVITPAHNKAAGVNQGQEVVGQDAVLPLSLPQNFNTTAGADVAAVDQQQQMTALFGVISWIVNKLTGDNGAGEAAYAPEQHGPNYVYVGAGFNN